MKQLYAFLLLFFVALNVVAQKSNELYLSGVQKLAKEDFKGAVQDFDAFIKANKKKPTYEAFLNRGRAYLAMELYKQALADFKKADEFKPADQEPTFQTAMVFYHQKNYDEAVKRLNQIGSKSPRITDVYRYLGMSFYQQKKYAQAKEQFDNFLKLDPENAEGYYFRGAAQLAQPNPPPQTCTDFARAANLGHPQAQEALVKYCAGK